MTSSSQTWLGIGIVVGGTVAVVAGTLLTAGMIDVALAGTAEAVEAGSLFDAFENAGIITHPGFAALPGMALAGLGGVVDYYGASEIMECH